MRGHRREVIDPKIEEYGGRIANTAGDSPLIEFPSAVEAVRRSLGNQAAMVARNAVVAEARRIRFRVGINLGDVIDADGDSPGDGVNVAARLEALADPGGVCLSRVARDRVRDRLALALEDLGEVEVKNIARPIITFKVLMDGGTETVPASAPDATKWRLKAERIGKHTLPAHPRRAWGAWLSLHGSEGALCRQLGS